MTTGIYALSFNGTEKVYIGQSINIEARYIQHISRFKLGEASPKLQEAYTIYGKPNLNILLECSSNELNEAENEAIEIYNSVVNGFNTLSEAGPPMLYGEKVGTAKEDNDTYLWVLELLVSNSPTFSKREIADITGVSIYTIRHIAALESHTWLAEVSPIHYARLVELKNTKPYYTGSNYPEIVSPDGVVYKVEHVTNFAKQHGLLQPKLTELLRGTRNMHKGWKRA